MPLVQGSGRTTKNGEAYIWQIGMDTSRTQRREWSCAPKYGIDSSPAPTSSNHPAPNWLPSNLSAPASFHPG